MPACAGLLHWFTSPYVRQLVFDKKSNTMEIETLSVFARPQITRAHLAEISYPDTIRPQVTFAVSHWLHLASFAGSPKQLWTTCMSCHCGHIAWGRGPSERVARLHLHAWDLNLSFSRLHQVQLLTP